MTSKEIILERAFNKYLIDDENKYNEFMKSGSIDSMWCPMTPDEFSIKSKENKDLFDNYFIEAKKDYYNDITRRINQGELRDGQ